jgi:hypothetical protein
MVLDGKSVVEDLGIALWQILHDANEAENKRDNPE